MLKERMKVIFYADAGLGGYGRKCTGHHLGHAKVTDEQGI